MPRSAASDLSQHCLHISHKKDDRHKRIKMKIRFTDHLLGSADLLALVCGV